MSDETGPGGGGGTGPGRMSDEVLQRLFWALPIVGFIVLALSVAFRS